MAHPSVLCVVMSKLLQFSQGVARIGAVMKNEKEDEAVLRETDEKYAFRGENTVRGIDLDAMQGSAATS